MGDTEDDHQRRWAGLVLALAEMPDVAVRLGERHVADPAGRCRGCTTGGYGTSHVRWPCTLHALADQATALARRRGLRSVG